MSNEKALWEHPSQLPDERLRSFGDLAGWWLQDLTIGTRDPDSRQPAVTECPEHQNGSAIGQESLRILKKRKPRPGYLAVGLQKAFVLADKLAMNSSRPRRFLRGVSCHDPQAVRSSL